MTGHLLAMVALVVALGLFTAALMASLGPAWGAAAAGALWAAVAALLVDPEALRR